MQEENKPKPLPSDTISLASVRSAFYGFFSLLFQGIEWVASSLRRNFLWFIGGCIVGALGGLVYYLMVPQLYQSQMILNYTELTRKDYYEIINNLNNLVVTRSYDDLKTELGLAPEVVKDIRSIKTVRLDGESLEKDTSSKQGQPFKVLVNLNHIRPTKEIQDALLGYINKNPYLKDKKAAQKRIFEEKLVFIEQEQKKLDSLKTSYNNALVSSRMSATFYNNAMNPAEIYVHSNNLANQRESILRWLSTDTQAVVLLDGLKKPMTTKRFSLRTAVMIGFLWGMLLGLILALFASLYRSVKKYQF